MATKIRITRTDVLKNKIVAAGWYPCLVKDIEEKAAKSDGSQNWFIKLEIKGGPHKEFVGVESDRVFNEKAAGFSVKYFQAFGINVGDEGGDFDFQRTKGKMVMAYWKPGKDDNGNTVNRVEDFRPMDGATQGGPAPAANEPPKVQ